MKVTNKLHDSQDDVSLDQTRKWYDGLYACNCENAMRPLSAYKVFVDHLKVFGRGQRLLDIGCGTGYLLKQAEQKNLRASIGVDASQEAAKVAKRVATKSEIITADAHYLPFKDRAFDYITILGSLEHFSHLDIALKEMHRVCKNNGQLCIVVPNSYYLFDIIGVLRSGYSNPGTEQPYEKIATLNEWRDLLEGSGFIVSKVLQDKGPPPNPIIKVILESRNPKFIAKRILRRFLRAVMPLNLTYQFVFIAKKVN